MIRRYRAADLHGTALVWFKSGIQVYAYLPEFQKLNQAQAQQVFSKIIEPQNSIWVFEQDAQIIGFIALQDSYIDRLYVDPMHQNRGVGSALLNHAKTLHPDFLSLHTHQANHQARAFYARAGFFEYRLGLSPAPENVPDVECHWSGSSNTETQSNAYL
ncbi:MAG: GNAT family N-acetyltransferase [bacterium]